MEIGPGQGPIRLPSPAHGQRALTTPLSTLILFAVLAAGCNSPQPPSQPIVREPTYRELVEQVRDGSTTEIVTQEAIGDDELALLDGLEGLHHLAIENYTGTTTGLSYLARLANLERLQLRGGELGDEAMGSIAACKQLKNLNLPAAQFSDVGLAALASLPHLELLRFHSPAVTDDGMLQIARMPNLRFLHLIRVPITDAGLAHLETMEQLESFYVDDAEVSDDGIERLLKARPGLHLHIDQNHSDRDPSKGTHPH